MAEPALKRAKTSRAVVEYVHRQIFDGHLRSGDRIDVELISNHLGVSPTPVREALMLLERDGVVTTRLHRAALVEHFDARTLRADFHVLGLLSGVAVARVAKEREPAVIAELERLLEELGQTPAEARDRIRDLVTELMRVQHRAGATPRLRAELRGFSGFLEWAARNSDRRTRDQLLEAHTLVMDAVLAGNSRRASQYRLDDLRAAGEEVIGDLVRRGVLPDDADAKALG